MLARERERSTFLETEVATYRKEDRIQPLSVSSPPRSTLPTANMHSIPTNHGQYGGVTSEEKMRQFAESEQYI